MSGAVKIIERLRDSTVPVLGVDMDWLKQDLHLRRDAADYIETLQLQLRLHRVEAEALAPPPEVIESLSGVRAAFLERERVLKAKLRAQESSLSAKDAALRAYEQGVKK